MTVLTATEAGRLVVYGASDDLVEFRGAIDEELSVWHHHWRLTFSHGPVLELRYTNHWRWVLDLERSHGPAALEVIPARGDDAVPRDDEDGCPGYSDKLVLDVPAGTIVEVVKL